MDEKTIPPEVIDKLMSQLEALMPQADVTPLPTVKITADSARLFPQPQATRKDFRTLTKGAELALFGRYGDFVGLKYDDCPYWTHLKNVELPIDFDTDADDPKSKPISVKISTLDAPLFEDHVLSRRIGAASMADHELPLLGSFGNSVLLEHDDKPVWTHVSNVEMDPSHWVTLSSPDQPGGGLVVAKAKTGGILAGWGNKLQRKAFELHNEYVNNEYLRIKGFSIQFAALPSLTIEFEFKV